MSHSARIICLVAGSLAGACGGDGFTPGHYVGRVELERDLVQVRFHSDGAPELGQSATVKQLGECGAVHNDGACDPELEACEPTPTPCVDTYRIVVDGVVLEEASADVGVWKHLSLSGLSVGDAFQLTVDGCHGFASFDIVVPTPPAAVSVSAPNVDVRESTTTVTWAPAGEAPQACLSVSFVPGYDWCCGADSGSLSVPTAGSYFNWAYLTRIWSTEVLELPDGHRLELWEVDNTVVPPPE